MTQSDQTDIELQAAAWYARLASDDASEKDYLQFEQWISDPKHRAAFDALQLMMFDVEDNANALREALVENDRAPGSRSTPRRPARRRGWKVSGAIAAVATMAAAYVLMFYQASVTPPIEGIVYAAAPDKTQRITLADNTEITLNRGTEITVYWGETERRVVLSEGEAAFKVQHNEKAPMSVIVGADEIRDVGTVFNVLKDKSRLTVTVAEGEVAVVSASNFIQHVQSDFQYEVDHSSHDATIQPVRPEDAMAWQQGHLVYRDAVLSDIIRDINRYSDVPVRISDDSIMHLTFSGTLKIAPASTMLHTLEKFMPVEVTETGGALVVGSRK
ncbi:FecR domain-containing protein [Hyphomonas sp.]|uniref:FecR family protein n=1 Tax=Hyphomonas sp. TaxID=87 RepID=UPI003528DFBD